MNFFDVFHMHVYNEYLQWIIKTDCVCIRPVVYHRASTVSASDLFYDMGYDLDLYMACNIC